MGRKKYAPRVGCDIPLTVWVDGRAPLSATITDLARGGMRARFDALLPIGTPVVFRCTLPTGGRVGGEATVVRATEKPDGGTGEPMSMAFRFDALNGACGRRLDRFVARRVVGTSNAVRVELPTLDVPLRATAGAQSGSTTLVRAALPFLQVDRKIKVDGQAGRLRSVDIHVDATTGVAELCLSVEREQR